MRNRAEWIAGGLGSAVLLAVIGVFAVTHYQAVVHPGAQQASLAQQTGPVGLSFPTVEQMCKAAGAGAADMADCVNEETSAAEFVGAWLELNGFVNNGRIDLEQIQLSAELDAADDPGLVGGSLSADPLDADPLSTATPADSGPVAPDADNALPGTPTSSSSSPAQIALLCLQNAADDWLKMHDCIAHNDPSSTLDGN